MESYSFICNSICKIKKPSTVDSTKIFVTRNNWSIYTGISSTSRTAGDTARPEAPPRIRVASSRVTKGVRARACAAESVGGGCWWRWVAEGCSDEGWQPAATVSVVAGSGGSNGSGAMAVGGGSTSPGVAFRRRGWKSRETEGCPRHSLVLARTRTPGWPGVLLWIRRSRLDIDKWLAEGEPNTAPLLHMQGHPFVRTWARGKERGQRRRRWRLRQRG